MLLSSKVKKSNSQMSQSRELYRWTHFWTCREGCISCRPSGPYISLLGNVIYCCQNYPTAVCADLVMPPPRRGGGIKRWSASVVRLSVCLMSRTSAVTRKPKGLGRRNFAQGYPRSHATPTPTSRSKGQKSRWGGGILWRRLSRTACYVCWI